MFRRHIYQSPENDGGGAGLADAKPPAQGAGLASDKGSEFASLFLAKKEQWRELLPPEHRTADTFSKFDAHDNPIGALANSYRELEKALYASDKIPKPQKDWTPREWKKFYQQLGAPEDATGYEIKPPEGMKLDETRLARMKEAAAFLNLTPAQLEGLVRADADYMASLDAQTKSSSSALAEKFHQEITEEWGDAYPERYAAAGEALRHLFGEKAEEIDRLKVVAEDGSTAFLTDHPTVLKALAKLGLTLGESKPLPRSGALDPALTPADAQAQINTVNQRLSAIRFDPNHPDYGSLMSQRQQLYERAYPGVPEGLETVYSSRGE